MKAPLIVLSAGGTGGHLFPAESLATALKRKECRVVLMTDGRVGGIAGSFPADEVVQVTSASPSGGSLLKKGMAAIKLGLGTISAIPALRRLKPAAAVGFGGYPTVPPLMAASFLGIPVVVHEQNGVMGRANRLLAPRAALIATGLPEVRNIPAGGKAKTVYTGNPIRPAVIEAAKVPFTPLTQDGEFRILVFGGSQGARIMSDIVPEAVKRLPAELRARLRLTQQARAEDVPRVEAVYSELGIRAEIQPFFRDLPSRMAEAQLVVARSGASTVAELSVLGRPSLLVPLPGSLDQDQAANAQYLANAGAATMILQNDFTPERLAQEIRARFDDPGSLAATAAAAAALGVVNAGERLAEAVMNLVSDTNRLQG